MVKQAARARMSISSYIRRCLAAFIALDLGMTFEEAATSASGHQVGHEVSTEPWQG